MYKSLFASLFLTACGATALLEPAAPAGRCAAKTEVTGYQCAARCFQPRAGQVEALPCETFGVGGGPMLFVGSCEECPRLTLEACPSPAALPVGEPCPGTAHCMRAVHARSAEGFYCLWGEDVVVRDDCAQCPDFAL